MAHGEHEENKETKPLGPEEVIHASDQYDAWFDSLSPLQQATQLLMEKICALNMGVTGALVGFNSTDTLRLVAEDLKVHIERFLAALEDEEVQNKKKIKL